VYKLEDLDINGVYNETGREEREGTTDTLVIPSQSSLRAFTGYETPEAKEVLVTADGKAESVYEYRR
jgi:hypothetical protein